MSSQSSAALPDFLCSGNNLNAPIFPSNFRRKNKSLFAQKQSHFKDVSVFYWNGWKVMPISISVITILLSLHWASPARSSIIQHLTTFPHILWTTNKMIKFLFFCGVLTVLPFCRSKTFQLLQHSVTAILLVVSVMQLEILFERRQCLVMYMMFMVVYRLFDHRTYFDNIAICIAYTADVAAINHAAQSWYNSSNLFVWIFLLVGCLLSHLYRRMSYRIWEHIRILIILREKTKQEKLLGNFLVSGHISRDLHSHLFPSIGDLSAMLPTVSGPVSNNILRQSISSSRSTQSGADITSAAQSQSVTIGSGSRPYKQRRNYSNKAFLKPLPTTSMNLKPQSHSPSKISRDNSSMRHGLVSERRNSHVSSASSVISNHSVSATAAGAPHSLYGILQSNKLIDDDLRRAASMADIVSHFADSTVSTAQLDTVCGLDRRRTVLIAIRLERPTVSRDCVFNSMQEADFLESVDYLARAHRVTRARLFGNIWIGCVGCFSNTWESDAVNVYHAVVFTCEVASIARQSFDRASYAVEYGNLVCGFTQGGALSMDFFGQEIRWLLMSVELTQYGEVALGEGTRIQLNIFRREMNKRATMINTASVPIVDSSDNIDTNIVDISCKRISVEKPWLAGSKLYVNYVVNVSDIVDPTSVQTRLNEFYTTTKSIPSVTVGNKTNRAVTSPFTTTLSPTHSVRSLLTSTGIRQGPLPTMDWFDVQCILDRDAEGEQKGISSATEENMLTLQHKGKMMNVCIPPEYRHIQARITGSGHITSHRSSEGICIEKPLSTANNDVTNQVKEIRQSTDFPLDLQLNSMGIEFQTSVYERYGVHLDDPVLGNMSVEELRRAHQDIEKEVYEIVFRECFPNFFAPVLMTSVYQDVHGNKEYPRCTVGNNDYGMFSNILRYIIRIMQIMRRVCVDKNTAFNRHYSESHGDVELQAVTRPLGHNDSFYVEQTGFLNMETLEHSGSNSNQTWLQRLWSICCTCCQRHVFIRDNTRVQPLDDDSDFDHVEDVDNYVVYALQSKQVGKAASVVAETSEAVERGKLWSSMTSLVTSCNVQGQQILGLRNIRDVKTESESSSVFKRSWFKYSCDARLWLGSSRFTACLDTLLMLVTWHVMRPAHNTHHSSRYMSVLLSCSLAHLVLSITVNRRYDAQLRLVLISLRFAFLYFLPGSVLCANSSVTGDRQYGDCGGDVVILLLLAFRITSQLQQNIWLTAMDCFMVRVLMVPFWRSGDCLVTSTARLMSLIFPLLLTVLEALVTHRAFVSYIVEHKFVPFACDSYRRQKDNSRALLKTFAPCVTPSQGKDLYISRQYRACAVTALHVKAPDILCGFIDAKELDVLLRRINVAVDEAIADCGLLKVAQFSGITLAVTCRDSSWQGMGTRCPSDSYTTRTVALLHRIQKLTEQFAKDFSFNVPICVAANHGCAGVGFLGSGQYSFDVMGSARDVCSAMVSHNSDGMYASSFFEEDVKSSSLAREVWNSKHKLDKIEFEDHPRRTEERQRPFWLRIDGVLSGMQLEDFEYRHILGRGGFGSVHLVLETNTGVEYAIKVVAPKAGSVMSKMITRECIILQMMQHPNVLSLKFAFARNSRMYMVMTYIQGGNLRQIMERDKPELKHLTLWFAELILALEYVHNSDIIHRDVKPSNCMIGTDGHLRLADFGLSKIVTTPSNLALSGLSSGASVGSKDSLSQFYRRYEEDVPVVDTMGLTRETYRKIQKFLPLKLALVKSKSQSKHTILNTISVRGTIRNTCALKFDSMTVKMLLARSVEDAVQIVHSNKYKLSAIFIDVDPKPYDIPGSWDPLMDGIALLKRLCADCFHSLDVCITTTTLSLSKVRKAFLNAGARDVLSVPLSDCDERLFRRLLRLPEVVSEADNTISSSINNSSAVVNFSTSSPETSRAVTTADNNHSKNSVSKQASQHSAVGTIHFMAPEVLRTARYDKTVDWWAVGITIYECTVGAHLFAGENEDEVFRQITLETAVILTALQPYGDSICSLVGGLLIKNVQRRLGCCGADQIKFHPFFAHINWDTVSETVPEYIPLPFPDKQFDLKDKREFLGEPDKAADGKIYCGDHDSNAVTEHRRYTTTHKGKKRRNKPTKSSGRNSHESSSYISSGNTSAPAPRHGSKKSAHRKTAGRHHHHHLGPIDLSTEILREVDDEEEEMGEDDVEVHSPHQSAESLEDVKEEEAEEDLQQLLGGHDISPHINSTTQQSISPFGSFKHITKHKLSTSMHKPGKDDEQEETKYEL